MSGSAQGHIIVCGLGHVGYRVATLLRRLGLEVAVVHSAALSEWVNEVRAAGAECVDGDASDLRVLQRAGAERARAVIAVTDRDLVNLSVAVDARRLNPSAVTVVRLHDRELAAHVESALGARQVLSTSALAAPMFIAAALGQEAMGYFSVGGQAYEVLPSPGPGDESLLIEGTEAPAREIGLGRVTRAAVARRRPWTSLWSLLRAGGAVFGQAGWAVKAPLLILLAVVVLGVAIIHGAMDVSYVDALYFAVTTITTVGYGDLNFQAQSPGLKIFGCLLMLSGAALLAMLFGIVTNALLSYRLRDVLQRQPTRKRRHVIVAGGGRIGDRIAEHLARDGHEVVHLCGEGDEGERHGDGNLEVLRADPRATAGLERAGVRHAAALIAVHDDDTVNLSIGLQARKLNPDIRTVARVFDGVLAEKLQAQLEIDAVLSVSAASAPAFVAAALYEDALMAAVCEDHLLVVRGPSGGIVGEWLKLAEPLS